jgi:hypothetical protein
MVRILSKYRGNLPPAEGEIVVLGTSQIESEGEEIRRFHDSAIAEDNQAADTGTIVAGPIRRFQPKELVYLYTDWKIMLFPVTPDIFNRIELRRIYGNKLNWKPPGTCVNKIMDQATAVAS